MIEKYRTFLKTDFKIKDGEHTAKICEQLYDLAKLAHGSLTPERMTKFIARSGEIMMLMTGEK